MQHNTKEEWRPIRGYESLYEVSNYGNVRSINRRIELKQETTEKGYKRVWLIKDGKGQHKKVHRLVAEAFIPNPDNLPQINHISGDKSDNRVCNLEWCDNRYNTIDSIKRKKSRTGIAA